MKRPGIISSLAAVAICPLLTSAPAAVTTTSDNLIAGGDAEAGYCTNDWHAATTMPGWTITRDDPNVMCYSAGSFSLPASGSPGRALFAPGDQGDSAMTQTVDVSSAAAAIDSGSTTFDLSGWLGGWGSYPGYALVSLTPLDRQAQPLGGAASLPTVSAADRGFQNAFLARSTTGAVPAGTRALRVDVQFLDSGAETGYADNLSLTLSTPVAAPGLAPPPSRVPRFDHVFTIMMENTNYSAVQGDTWGMPYLHGLMAQGVSMSDYHAVYHPSDENYLAVSGGDTFAQGAVYWPNIHDPNAHLGDELEAAGRTWKAYEQGMGVPCNADPSTEHTYDSYYAPDDAPFIHYDDVSGDAARCRAHLVDSSQLGTDLQSAGSTPAFAWVAPDDYYDGESAGDGNAQSRQVQDGWLRQTVEPILASPAWRDERSLLIITWDEAYGPSGTDPANHVATVVLGSQGTVRAGATGATRSDHYSTGRTIEEALGVGPITANDRYATPLNDAFA